MRTYLCKYQGCDNLVNKEGEYCSVHVGYIIKRKPFEGASRSSLYKEYKWKALSKRILQQHPYCAICGREDELIVHHIIPHRGNIDLFYDEENMVVVCKECHSTLTAQEINNRRPMASSKKKYKKM